MKIRKADTKTKNSTRNSVRMQRVYYINVKTNNKGQNNEKKDTSKTEKY